MKYRLAVFDMDGTILDTLGDLTDSLNHVLTLHGMPQRGAGEVRLFMGNGIRRLVELGVPAGTDSQKTDAVFADFAEYYPEHCHEKTCAYDGIPELLLKLRENGVLTAVVSNKIDCAVQELCVKYFNGMFNAAVGEKEGIRKKPCPDSVNSVLKQLGVRREEAVYIGDTEVDIATAENSQMDCIAVDWGFRDREVLEKLSTGYLVSKPSEIYDIINSQQ